jgi:hypothetical protein
MLAHTKCPRHCPGNRSRRSFRAEPDVRVCRPINPSSQFRHFSEADTASVRQQVAIAQEVTCGLEADLQLCAHLRHSAVRIAHPETGHSFELSRG